MRNTSHTEPADDSSDWIERELTRFGFNDLWESWMDRIREIESPSSLGSIGPYEILRRVGRGGQGVVFQARRVATGEIFALKRLIGGEYASTESRKRLERELEAASTLDSPFIVRVFGIDTIDEQPVLAMEWIDGQSITQWAARAGSEPSEALRLFADVCDGVHHAHRRGVLHRDLKPSNIMVDAAGRPRLLDFGLALFMAAPAGDALTAPGMFVGTPDYSAPERLASGGAFADVRSDVYALGVVLYELITGRMPSAGEDRRGRIHGGIEGAAHPARPSTIRALIEPELDAIVLKALDPDPNRRYQSAEALGADVRRYLAGEAVEARPPSAIAAARRFLRRHRVAAAFGLTIVTLVTAGGIVASVLAVRLAERTRVAEASRRTTERINSFLMGVLVSARPARAGGDGTVVSLLEHAASRADASLADAPEVRADVHACLGRTYETLGENRRAAESLKKAAAIYAVDGPAASEKLARTLHDLVGALAELHDAEAVEVSQRAVELAESMYGEADPRVAAARAANGYAIWKSGGSVDEAERLVRDAVLQLDAAWPAQDPLLAVHRGLYGSLLVARGDLTAGRREFERALATLRRFATSESEFAQGLASSLGEYAQTLVRLGDTQAAAAVIDELKPIHARLYGARRDARWRWWMARMEWACGRMPEAVRDAHLALASGWRAPAANADDGGLEEAGFFTHAPLERSTPDEYSCRVFNALRRRGDDEAGTRTAMMWLADLLRNAGYAEYADAVRARVGGIRS